MRFYFAAALTSIIAFSGMLLAVTPAQAALFDGSKDQACNGANLDEENTGCTASTDTSDQVTNTLRTVLNILSFVVGVVAVIMLIIGGIRFVTSQGEGSSTALARNTIIYAVVGIVIAVLAQALVQFVVGRSTTSNTPTSDGPNTSVDSRNAH
jgi:hypothetical protein